MRVSSRRLTVDNCRSLPLVTTAAAVTAVVGRRSASARRLLRDCDTGGVHDVPLAAVEVQALTLRLARLLVEEEPVERMPMVGHLQLAVRSPRRSEQRGLDA